MFAEAVSSPGHAEFARRVARINSGAASSKRTLFVGMDESYVIPLKPGKGQKAAGGSLGNAMAPLSLILAFGIGVAAHGLALVARFHLVGLPKIKANPDVEMLTQFVLGFLLALMCAKALRLKEPSQQLARSLGVVAAVLLAHNLVHAYPEEAGRVFSPLWVADVVTSTKPHSVLFRGLSFPF